jgi:hypothetical protein
MQPIFANCGNAETLKVYRLQPQLAYFRPIANFLETSTNVARLTRPLSQEIRHLLQHCYATKPRAFHHHLGIPNLRGRRCGLCLTSPTERCLIHRGPFGGPPRSRGTANFLALTSFIHTKGYRNSIASVRSRGKTELSPSQTHTLRACFLFTLRTYPPGSGSPPQALIFPHQISLKKSNPVC